jgi:hypothetical protein
MDIPTLLSAELVPPRIKRRISPEQVHEMLTDRYINCMSVKKVCKKYKIGYVTWSNIDKDHAYEFRTRFVAEQPTNIPSTTEQMEYWNTSCAQSDALLSNILNENETLLSSILNENEKPSPSILNENEKPSPSILNENEKPSPSILNENDSSDRIIVDENWIPVLIFR